MYVFSNTVRTDDSKIVGTFSSHWAATAAMLRTWNPKFESPQGDKADDLAEEILMADRIKDELIINGVC